MACPNPHRLLLSPPSLAAPPPLAIPLRTLSPAHDYNYDHHIYMFFAISGIVAGLILCSILMLSCTDGRLNPHLHDIENGSETDQEEEEEEEEEAERERTLPIVVCDRKLNDCAVCLEELEAGTECRVIPACNHMYHKPCIDQWLSDKDHCPLCRVYVWGSDSDQGNNQELAELNTL